MNNNSEVVSVGRWIGVFILSMIPFANIVLLLVWAFGSNENKNISNYAKAIVCMILFFIAVVLTVIIFKI